MVILYNSMPKRGQHWQQRLKQDFPDVEFRLWPDHGDLNEVTGIVVWKVDTELLAQLPNLQVIFTVSAGIDQIPLDCIPESVQLIRMIDHDLEQQLTEYSCATALSIYRGFHLYREAQAQSSWKPHSVGPASEYRIGVMGLGQQGKAILRGLKPFGFALSGWARSQYSLEGVDCFAGNEHLPDFLNQLDILLCVLPLTEQTRDILNQTLFEQLPQGAALINIGRGEHLVEQDLINALNEQHVSYAVLDVTREEPLPKEHPFWLHPKIMLTPHAAGLTRPESGYQSFIKNLQSYLNGEKAIGWVDRNKGY